MKDLTESDGTLTIPMDFLLTLLAAASNLRAANLKEYFAFFEPEIWKSKSFQCRALLLDQGILPFS
jgi:hypothetical protein